MKRPSSFGTEPVGNQSFLKVLRDVHKRSTPPLYQFPNPRRVLLMGCLAVICCLSLLYFVDPKLIASLVNYVDSLESNSTLSSLHYYDDLVHSLPKTNTSTTSDALQSLLNNFVDKSHITQYAYSSLGIGVGTRADKEENPFSLSSVTLTGEIVTHYRQGVDYIWQHYLFHEEQFTQPTGLVILLGNCDEQAVDWFPSSSVCPHCQALPMHHGVTESLLRAGYVVVVIPPVINNNKIDISDKSSDSGTTTGNCYHANDRTYIAKAVKYITTKLTSRILAGTGGSARRGLPTSDYFAPRRLPLFAIGSDGGGAYLAKYVTTMRDQYGLSFNAIAVINSGLWSTSVFEPTKQRQQAHSSLRSSPPSTTSSRAAETKPTARNRHYPPTVFIDFARNHHLAIQNNQTVYNMEALGIPAKHYTLYPRHLTAHSFACCKGLNAATTTATGSTAVTGSSSTSTSTSTGSTTHSSTTTTSQQHLLVPTAGQSQTRNEYLCCTHGASGADSYSYSNSNSASSNTSNSLRSDGHLRSYLLTSDQSEALFTKLTRAGYVWPTNGLLLKDPKEARYNDQIIQMMRETVPALQDGKFYEQQGKHLFKQLMQILHIAWGYKEVTDEPLPKVIEWFKAHS